MVTLKDTRNKELYDLIKAKPFHKLFNFMPTMYIATLNGKKSISVPPPTKNPLFFAAGQRKCYDVIGSDHTLRCVWSCAQYYTIIMHKQRVRDPAVPYGKVTFDSFVLPVTSWGHVIR